MIYIGLHTVSILNLQPFCQFLYHSKYLSLQIRLLSQTDFPPSFHLSRYL